MAKVVLLIKMIKVFKENPLTSSVIGDCDTEFHTRGLETTVESTICQRAWIFESTLRNGVVQGASKMEIG